MMIRIMVDLHTVLQQYAPAGTKKAFEMQVSEGSRVQDVLAALKITYRKDGLIFVIDHRMVDENALLADQDRLDIIPAISGG